MSKFTKRGAAPSAPTPVQVPAPDVSGDGSDSPAAATVEAAVGGDPSSVEREPQEASDDATATMTDEGDGSAAAPTVEQDASDEGQSKKQKRRLGRREKGEEQHG